jgi:hypothetical protein
MRLQLDCTYADTARLVVTEIEGGLEGPASHEVTQFADDRADGEAVFAPTGRRIAFARTSYLENRTDIYTIKRNGTKLRLVVRDASSPTWQPRKR